MAKYEVRFMAPTGKFSVAKTETFSGFQAADQAVREYAHANGVFRVLLVGTDDEGFRWTATTPGGRAGRNIAFCDGNMNSEEEV